MFRIWLYILYLSASFSEGESSHLEEKVVKLLSLFNQDDPFICTAVKYGKFSRSSFHTSDTF